VRAGGGSTGSFLFGVLAYNAGGGGLGGAFIASIPGPIATTWSDVSGILPLPSNTATVEPLLYLNWDNVTLTRPGWMEAQDIRLEEVLPSTLIKDGAITTAKIQAGAITAGTLFVKPTGAAINFDPGVSDQSAWTDVGGAGYPALITAVSDGMTGATSLRSQSGQMAVMNSRSYFAIDPNKTYRVHAWVRQSTPANGSAFTFALDVLNAGGVYLGAAFPINQTCNCGAWTELIATFTKAALPVGTTQITPRIYLNNGGGSTGWMEAQDIRIEEVLPSTLIKDGAITTTKIAAHTITGDNIKAGSITANEINVAAGYGANLIANSTFEGATPALGLAGWTQDLLYPDGAMVNSCCGIHGPGTLYLAPGAGQWTVADYLAVPVSYGQTYRVAMDVYAGQATPAGLYVRMLQSNTNSAPRYVRGGGTIPPGDVGADTVSDICANCGLAVGWNHIELVYTPPSPTTWVTMSLFDYTCPQGAAAVCQSLHFDGVEMEQQIGAGSIKAGSITGDRIAARTIISGNIATGTLGANEIAARSLTADRLVANTITSNEIGVRAIVAGNIATGTLTANEIAANTITANKLSVSTLSAITANLGTVTAGSLSAVTITGSTITGTTVTAGCATMDSNGITLSPGGGACNSYKFAGSGVGLWSDGGAWTYLYGQNLQVTGTGSGGYVNFTSDTTIHGANQVLIDSNNNQVHFYNSGYIQLSVSSLSGTAAGSHLCLTTDNYLIRCT
jgi:hypothetical protein